jgi:hypothetical protein
MVVFAINGTPRTNANTEMALKLMADVLMGENVKTQIIQI